MKEKTRTKLKKRDIQIINYVARGYQDKEIAEKTELSYSSIRRIINEINLITGTVNRAHLVFWAFKEKIIKISD